jgi:hypothetical protein
MAKKYRIISGFTYKGEDGKAKQEKWVRIGPGEEVPKLNSDELNKFISQEKIAEISAETGEVIQTKKVTTLNDIEMERFIRKSTPSILAALQTDEFSIETLGKMIIIAEREKLDNRIKTALEEKLNKKVSA